MFYSLIGALAIAIHLIINSGVFRNEGRFPARRSYCFFLYSVIAYHATDALWGIINDLHNVPLLYADTVVYFVMMGLSVLLWSEFVLRYLEGVDQAAGQKQRFAQALNYAGRGFFVFQMLALVVKFFSPLLFSIDRSGEYQAGVLRHMAFVLQMGMFLFTSAYAVYISRDSDAAVKRRHRTIALFGVSMVGAIAVQLYFPLLPMYSIGYMLGGCALHTFVVEDEKASYLRALEESMGQETKQRRELSATRHKAYSDPLTGVKSKHAYMEAASYLYRRIVAGDIRLFAVAVFDVIGLKQVNDEEGYEAGDRTIKEACGLVCEVFKHSPVYRIGGDEFAVILEGKDCENRDALMTAFNGLVEHNRENGLVAVTAGMSVFDPKRDETYSVVFQRANKAMNERKRALKGQGAQAR